MGSTTGTLSTCRAFSHGGCDVQSDGGRKEGFGVQVATGGASTIANILVQDSIFKLIELLYIVSDTSNRTQIDIVNYFGLSITRTPRSCQTERAMARNGKMTSVTSGPADRTPAAPRILNPPARRNCQPKCGDAYRRSRPRRGSPGCACHV